MKLNLAVERARFEAAFIANRAKYAETHGLDVDLQIARVKESLEKGLVPAALFEMWIAAKEDAIEEAKPKAIVRKDDEDWWWIDCNGVSRGTFPSEGVAILTAEKEGLRVMNVMRRL